MHSSHTTTTRVAAAVGVVFLSGVLGLACMPTTATGAPVPRDPAVAGRPAARPRATATWAAEMARHVARVTRSAPGGGADCGDGRAVKATDVHALVPSLARSRKVVALTFDDGPNPPFTQRVLAILTAAHVPATFFVVGGQVAAWPKLVRAEARAGMAVENHTWDHVDLTRLPVSGYPAQVDRTTRRVEALTGRPVTCLRPPYGAVDPTVVHRLAARHLSAVLWDDDPRDWSRPGTAAIVARVLGELHPGAIVLMHDGGGDRSETVAALPTILRRLHARGYTVVPLFQVVPASATG